MTYDNIYFTEDADRVTFYIISPVVATQDVDFEIKILTNGLSEYILGMRLYNGDSTSDIVEHFWENGDYYISEYRFISCSSNSQFTVNTISNMSTYF